MIRSTRQTLPRLSRALREFSLTDPRLTSTPKFAWRAYQSKTSTNNVLKSQEVKRVNPFAVNQPDAWTVGNVDEADALLEICHPEYRRPCTLSLTWLRDQCLCEACVDPHSGQKRFSTVDVPTKHLAIETKIKRPDGDLELVFPNDFLTGQSHTTVIPGSIINRVVGGPRPVPSKPRTPSWVSWNKAELEARHPFLGYDAFLSDPIVCMAFLHTLGIVVLKGVPTSEKAIEEVASKIGPIQETFYGRTWDVKSKPNATNVADTDQPLVLHQDLLYMSDPPRIQILHCLQNTCEGGETVFSDGMRASKHMQKHHPKASAALLDHEIHYSYEADGYSIANKHAVLNGRHVKMSPQFQTPQQGIRSGLRNSKRWVEGVEAMRTLRDDTQAEENLFSYKMEPGDCVIFDNVKILHGRRKFDSTAGERWLKGTYISNDGFVVNGRRHASQIMGAVGGIFSSAEQTKEQTASEEANEPTG